jgi:hypothetical protein
MADTILGKPVQSTNGDDMGRIVDVMVDHMGQVRAAIIDFGGFLGVGTREIAVDWHVLHFPKSGEMNKIVAELSQDQLRASPIYKPGEPIVIVGGASTTPPASAPAAPAQAAPAATTPAPATSAPTTTTPPTSNPATPVDTSKPSSSTPASPAPIAPPPAAPIQAPAAPTPVTPGQAAPKPAPATQAPTGNSAPAQTP